MNGRCRTETGMQVVECVEAHADRILASGATMLTFGGDHFVTYPLLRAHAEVLRALHELEAVLHQAQEAVGVGEVSDRVRREQVEPAELLESPAHVLFLAALVGWKRCTRRHW